MKKLTSVRFGRNPDDIKVLFPVYPFLGETSDEARSKYQRMAVAVLFHAANLIGRRDDRIRVLGGKGAAARRPAGLHKSSYLLTVQPKVVQERLGHSTISVRLDLYTHVSATMQEEDRRRLWGR
jgi:alkanesulfonate monooxygenase SsuD/methylene tetrahydromethanopterin reductase-like flavin-dependent oxidoreductase (luciferase family)